MATRDNLHWCRAWERDLLPRQSFSSSVFFQDGRGPCSGSNGGMPDFTQIQLLALLLGSDTFQPTYITTVSFLAGHNLCRTKADLMLSCACVCRGDYDMYTSMELLRVKSISTCGRRQLQWKTRRGGHQEQTSPMDRKSRFPSENLILELLDTKIRKRAFSALKNTKKKLSVLWFV